MLAVTHLFVTLLLMQLLSLDRNESFVALLFGFGIDLDHLLGLKEFVSSNGTAALLDTGLLMDPGGQWKSMLHTPVASFVVGSLSAASRLAFPFLFWFIHVGLDQLEDSILGLFSIAEMILMVGSATALIAIRWNRFRSLWPGSSVADFLRSERMVLWPWRASRADAV